MKLLTNNYLKGSVGFESREGEGTTFRLWLPAVLS
jgi:signal transduction histidine kinase